MTKARIINHHGNVEEVSDHCIIADARKVSAADFFRAVTGLPPRVAAEIAETDARKARNRLAELVHKAEYTIARAQREQVIREGSRDGETYDEFRARMNEPFCKAAERVNRKLAEIEQRMAA